MLMLTNMSVSPVIFKNKPDSIRCCTFDPVLYLMTSITLDFAILMQRDSAFEIISKYEFVSKII